MGLVEFRGKVFDLDEDGFISSFDTWRPDRLRLDIDCRGAPETSGAPLFVYFEPA